MQVTETLAEGLKRSYTVVLPADDIETRRTARFTDLCKTIRLPGFRPGKVPMSMVRQRFGAAVNAEVLEDSVDKATRQVLSERGLRPAMPPRVNMVTQDPAAPGAARDLEFAVELELLPEISLPDFSAISLTRYVAEVPESEVERILENFARRQRKLEDIEEDRGAQKGDVLTLDFAGKVDGADFPGGTGEGIEAEVGGDGFVPGFLDQIEGMRPGESRSLRVTFPADYGIEALAGKEAQFEVTAKKVQRQILPAYDDALAESLGFDTLQDLRDVIARQVGREYADLSRFRLKRELLDALAERTQFAPPQGLVDAEFEQIWKRVEADRSQGRLDEEDKDKDEETLRAEYRAIADRRVRLGLLLAEIGRANQISVTQDELARAMRAEAARHPGQEQQIMEFFRKTPQAAENLRGPILEEKVVDFVIDLAQVTEQKVSPAELAKAAEEPPKPTTSSVPPAPLAEASALGAEAEAQAS